MQAVIRLSKQYLPGMAAGYNHPKVKVHVGDGFKFLDDYKNTFDVIITDSSDPDGPAESLFQKPYFQLMHDALREGGVITTQGCRFSLVLPCQFGDSGEALGTVGFPTCRLKGCLYNPRGSLSWRLSPQPRRGSFSGPKSSVEGLVSADISFLHRPLPATFSRRDC